MMGIACASGRAAKSFKYDVLTFWNFQRPLECIQLDTVKWKSWSLILKVTLFSYIIYVSEKYADWFGLGSFKIEMSYLLSFHFILCWYWNNWKFCFFSINLAPHFCVHVREKKTKTKHSPKSFVLESRGRSSLIDILERQSLTNTNHVSSNSLYLS